ncbi:MAG: hypothetical protein HQL80_10570 [Magnetococcales bacterium]|nr:hypothetical protein [Magnetococcales bacterium]
MAHKECGKQENTMRNPDSIYPSKQAFFDQLIEGVKRGEINNQKGLEMGLLMILEAFHQKKRSKKDRRC